MRRLAGATQVAAINGGKVVMPRVRRHRERLRLAGVIKGNVDLALDAFFNIPVGFTVADNAEACGHFRDEKPWSVFKGMEAL